VLSPWWGSERETGRLSRARLWVHMSRAWAPPVSEHGPRSATGVRVFFNNERGEAQSNRLSIENF